MLFKKISLHALILVAIAIPASSVTFTEGGVGLSAAQAADGLPAWAFLWDPTVQVPPPSDTPNTLPGSSAAFSWKQARDLFVALDWHPDAHPAMPDIVASGRKPEVRACGSCHRVEGTGGPENASLAGLPVAYFVQQIADFKSGARVMSGPQRSSTQTMLASVKSMTDAEISAAAEYFAALKRKPNIKVVEKESIPKTGPSRLFYVKSLDGGTELLGERIVEMPDNGDQFELRDSRATFTAYVPVGSVAKGEALAKAGNHRSLQCLSRTGIERPRHRSADRREIANLYHASTLRIPERRSIGRRKRPDEADCRQTHAARHDRPCRLRRLARSMNE